MIYLMNIQRKTRQVFEMRDVWFKIKYNNRVDDCTGTSQTQVQDGYEEAETQVLLTLPDSYSDTGAKTPLIFSAHGSGGIVNPDEEKGRGGIRYLNDETLEAYAAFDIHGTRPDGRSYGNRRYVEAVYKAYNYIVENYNVDPRLYVMGASMGGVCALNFVNFYPNIVRCIGLFYPRTNLHQEYVNGVLEHGSYEEAHRHKDFCLTEVIGTEYGFDDPFVWQDEKAVGLNPWHNRTVVIDGKRYSNLPAPIKIWHGDIDQSVQYIMSVEYIAALRRSGCYAELRTVHGIGHKQNAMMHEELKLWFDRFR